MSRTPGSETGGGEGASKGGASREVESLTPPQAKVVEGFRAGKRIALARVISSVEDERPGFQPLLHMLLKAGLHAARLGITGPPGAGKSTLVAALAGRYREREEEVGIVAVDPTSPYSGGALLGDRIRMHDVATDPGIFIRSMATRGSLGGLATTTKEIIDLLDAFGFARVIVETVGVGQSELEITGAADTVAVVLVPESGDGIQAMKAGLMEIADIFIVNKSDRPGADRLVKELRQALRLRGGDLRGAAADTGHHGVEASRAGRRETGRAGGDAERAGGGAGRAAGAGSSGRRQPPARRGRDDGTWTPPIVQTVGQSGEGVDELLEAVEAHREHLVASGELLRRRRDRARVRIRDVLSRELGRMAVRVTEPGSKVDEKVEAVVSGGETPYTVARSILEELGVGHATRRLPGGGEGEA